MSYKHITLNDRNNIEVLKQDGYSSRRIAKILNKELYNKKLDQMKNSLAQLDSLFPIRIGLYDSEQFFLSL